MSRIIANFVGGARRYVRFKTPPPTYTNGQPIACHCLETTKRRHLASDLPWRVADDWVNDGHDKPGWMRHNGVAFFELV